GRRISKRGHFKIRVLRRSGEPVWTDLPRPYICLIHRNQNVWPGQPWQVSERTARKAYAKNPAAMYGIGPGEHPAAQYFIPPATSTHKPPALTEWQIGGDDVYELVCHVESAN